MSTLHAPSIGDLDHLQKATDNKGRVYYFTYTRDEMVAECSKCRAGTCVQKTVWYADNDGCPDPDSLHVIHDCGKELN